MGLVCACRLFSFINPSDFDIGCSLPFIDMTQCTQYLFWPPGFLCVAFTVNRQPSYLNPYFPCKSLSLHKISLYLNWPSYSWCLVSSIFHYSIVNICRLLSSCVPRGMSNFSWQHHDYMSSVLPNVQNAHYPRVYLTQDIFSKETNLLTENIKSLKLLLCRASTLSHTIGILTSNAKVLWYSLKQAWILLTITCTSQRTA